jgi:hypothetical protein
MMMLSGLWAIKTARQSSEKKKKNPVRFFLSFLFLFFIFLQSHKNIRFKHGYYHSAYRLWIFIKKGLKNIFIYPKSGEIRKDPRCVYLCVYEGEQVAAEREQPQSARSLFEISNKRCVRVQQRRRSLSDSSVYLGPKTA